jgi:hypothetical protein
MATITIDGSWLSNTANSLHGDGAAPYKLATDHSVYRLTLDVNATASGYNGQVFVFTGKDIYLDLNGFSVRVGNKAIDQQLLSQKASQHAIKAVATAPVKNHGGVTIIQNGSTISINTDPASANNVQNVNLESF